MARSKEGQAMMLHTYKCPYQVSTSYTWRFLRYSPDKLTPATRPPIWTLWVKTISDLLNSDNLKVAITQLCHEL